MPDSIDRCRVRDALRRRFERAELRVRCGLSPDRPVAVLQYLALGAHLASCNVLDQAAVQRRMHRELLRTAGDEALPWFWRSVCLDHASRPLARLTTLLGHDAPALAAIRAAHDDAEAALPPPASSRRE